MVHQAFRAAIHRRTLNRLQPSTTLMGEEGRTLLPAVVESLSVNERSRVSTCKAGVSSFISTAGAECPRRCFFFPVVGIFAGWMLSAARGCEKPASTRAPCSQRLSGPALRSGAHIPLRSSFIMADPSLRTRRWPGSPLGCRLRAASGWEKADVMNAKEAPLAFVQGAVISCVLSCRGPL